MRCMHAGSNVAAAPSEAWAVAFKYTLQASSIVRKRARLTRDGHRLLLTQLPTLALSLSHSLALAFFLSAVTGSEILGHPMIVEPSHQQRLSSRYGQNSTLFFDARYVGVCLCGRARYPYEVVVASYLDSNDLRAAVQCCHLSDIFECCNSGLPSS